MLGCERRNDVQKDFELHATMAGDWHLSSKRGYHWLWGTSQLLYEDTEVVLTAFQVLASFMLSALMTVAAVAYAYLSDSMPANYLTETDAAFISAAEWTARRFLALKNIRDVVAFGSRMWNVLLRRDPDRPIRKLERSQREVAVTRFILTLSDQQLVVGIAILVAAIANQCTLPFIEFEVTFALAWFSTTTHLATLDSLRHYFVSHPTIRNLRVVGMLIMMALFFYAFVLQTYLQSAPDYTLPVQCYLTMTSQLWRAPILNQEWTGFRTDREIYISFPRPVPSSQKFIHYARLTVRILIFIYIALGYKDRVLQLYGFRTSHSRGQSNFTSKLLVQFLRLFGKVPKDFAGIITISTRNWTPILEEYNKERRAHNRARLLAKLLDTQHSLIQLRLARLMYGHSFLHVIPYLVFMLVFSFCQMLVLRWRDMWITLGDVNVQMGFGQITPLLLTVLPLLAAAEIYYGT